MKIYSSSKFAKEYKKLPRKVKVIAEEKEKIFRKDPFDPKLKNPISFSGINGKGTGYFTSIDVGLNNNFINTPVVFSNDISDNGYGILGQQGFFNNYKIEFDYRTKNIVLTP